MLNISITQANNLSPMPPVRVRGLGGFKGLSLAGAVMCAGGRRHARVRAITPGVSMYLPAGFHAAPEVVGARELKV